MSVHRGTFFSMGSHSRACVAALFCAASLAVLVLRSHSQVTANSRVMPPLAAVARNLAQKDSSETSNVAAKILADGVSAAPPLIGRTSTAVFVLDNSLSARTLQVAGTELSCSCASILKRPSEVSPNASDTIVIAFTPGAFDDDTKVQLSADLRGAYAGELRSRASTSAVSPFSGWPRCARARQKDGWTVITLEPQYVIAGLPERASAFQRIADTPLPTQILGGEVRIWGECHDIDLVIHFGDNRRATWSGPVIVTSD